jgi:hypothetical protein
MLMGSVVGVVAPSELRESLGRARGLEKEDFRFEVKDVTREFWPVGSYPRGGCGVVMERMGLAGGVRE